VSTIQGPAPSWWGRIDALPPVERAVVLERLKPRIRLRYTKLTPTPKQAVFLALQCQEAFYGGAAGPGKSTALMLAALQYVDVPGYRALLLRKTFAELEQPGALIDMSHEMLDETDARWNANKKRWTFPSGANLTFGYLEREAQKTRYQGAAYHFVGWDELTHFTPTMYEYLFSRQRRPALAPHLGRSPDGTTAATVPIRMRSASNPGGPGHEWVKARFVSRKTREAGAVFVPALLRENPHLDADAYVAGLMKLRGAERLRLLGGDWDARDDGEFFNRLTWPAYDDVDPWVSATRALRIWDLAGTKPSAANPDPDYTVGTRLELDHRSGNFCVTDVVRVRESIGEVETIIKGVASDDGRDVHIRMEQEPGSSGKAVIDRFRRHVLRGYVFKGVPSTGSKEDRAKPAAAAAEQGLIGYTRGAWNEDWFAELEAFPDSSHKDQVDTLSSGHDALSKAGPGTVKTAGTRRINVQAPRVSAPTVRVPRINRRVR
jgi:predicted phage terminase large subunit-like protein